jgi:hypothetical protein
MSFKSPLYYEWLMIPEYPETLKAYLTRWAAYTKLDPAHQLFKRLKGGNQFCEDKFWPDDQAPLEKKSYTRTPSGHRYTAVNYCHGLFGTLEYRALPTFEKVGHAIEAVKVVMDVTNATLAAVARKERDLVTDFTIRASDDEVVEEDIVRLDGHRERIRT